jgi:hypothetical protein
LQKKLPESSAHTWGIVHPVSWPAFDVALEVVWCESWVWASWMTFSRWSENVKFKLGVEKIARKIMKNAADVKKGEKHDKLLQSI